MYRNDLTFRPQEHGDDLLKKGIFQRVVLSRSNKNTCRIPPTLRAKAGITEPQRKISLDAFRSAAGRHHVIKYSGQRDSLTGGENIKWGEG